MKIAIFSYTFFPNVGGAEITLDQLIRYLKDRGHTVILYVPFIMWLKNIRQRYSYLIRPYFIPWFHTLFKYVPWIYLFFTKWYFSFLQFFNKFNVWIAWMAYPAGVALGNWQNKRVKRIVRCAGRDIQVDKSIGYGDRIDKRIDFLIRKHLPRLDFLVALSKSVKEEYIRIKVDENKIVEIPCGVDFKYFEYRVDRNSIRKKYNIPLDKFISITVGRNHPKKGFKDLVIASGILRKRNVENFCVVFVGKDVSKLKSLAERNGVLDKVLFIEEISWQEVVMLYKASDVCVFPSYVETLALIVIEAWAAKLPVITTDAPGCGEIVRDGIDGVIYHAGDVNELAESMQKVIKNVKFRNSIAEEGFRKFMKNYIWDVVVRKWESIFN